MSMTLQMDQMVSRPATSQFVLLVKVEPDGQYLIPKLSTTHSHDLLIWSSSLEPSLFCCEFIVLVIRMSHEVVLACPSI